MTRDDSGMERNFERQVPAAGNGHDKRLLSGIGAVAARTGVSERTLRYYEEVGLISPAAHRPGGVRRYCEADVERVRRIRELQGLMGFNLEEIRAIVSAEDHLESLRDRYRNSGDASHQRNAVEEAVAVLDDLRAQVGAKLGRLEAFLDELDGRVSRYREKLRSWDVEDQRASTSAR